MAPTVSEAMCSLESLGKQQYDQYVQDIITERTKSIHNPIKRNSPALLKRPKTKEKTKKGQQVQILQNNVALFGELYISMQNREGDLKDFFST